MRKIGENILFKGKWLSIKESVYINESGEEVRWESVDRSNSTNVVSVMAKMVPSGRIILIRQFRPSIDNFVIGFPAGLYSNEDPEEHALHELLEETGYTGKVTSRSPLLKTNAGTADTNMVIVCAEVDETLPVNQNPKQNLEPAEEIEVLLLHPSEIKDFITKEVEKGTSIGPGIWYFAISL